MTEPTTELALSVSGVSKSFPGKRRGERVDVLKEVSLQITSGTTLGLVGESGSGKSTLARCVLGLIDTDHGTIDVLGRRITGASAKQLRAWRRDMQVVFQDSYDSLNPRLKVGQAIAEPLRLHTDLSRGDVQARVRELLELVDLPADFVERHPHQLSGGQQQRVNIARAIATDARFVVLDEPTSSLDVSVRVGVLRLLVGLQEQLGLSYLLISHDLPTVRTICDSVAVMNEGRIVESGAAREVLTQPQDPYTRYLLGSELSVDPDVRPAPAPAPAKAVEPEIAHEQNA